MNLLRKLDSLVGKTKAEWRRTLTDSDASAEERRKARANWKSAVAKKDRAMTIWLQARSNRRQQAADRRKSADPEWQDKDADRRKAERAQGRRVD